MSNEQASVFITVTAPKRGDLPGYWTPQRCWPAGQPITVEVVMTEDGEDPKPFSFVRIGTKTLAQIEEESVAGRLSYKTADAPATPVDNKGRLELDEEIDRQRKVKAPTAAGEHEPGSGPTKRRTFTHQHK